MLCSLQVQPGDCVVAFSRHDIFAIQREIEKLTKHKCCIIYGSLPPEVRTAQAQLFNHADSGHNVLVASDAIRYAMQRIDQFYEIVVMYVFNNISLTTTATTFTTARL